MATVSFALYSQLSNHAGLTALVATRIYPGLIPQEQVLPYVVFVRTDEDSESMMAVDTDLDETLFEVTSFGDTYDSCEAVHEQVRLALRRFRGSLGGVTVQDTLLRGGEGPISIDDPAMYEASQRVAIRYTRV